VMPTGTFLPWQISAWKEFASISFRMYGVAQIG
jgi:hypothetical protein